MNTITNNHTVAGETGGIYVTWNSQWLSLAGDPCEGTYNTIWGNDGYQVYNDNAANPDNDINAVYVQWATCDANEIEAGIFHCDDNMAKACVLYDPFVCPGALSNTCWDPGECAGQPLGDATCDGNVNFLDLGALKVAFFSSKGDVGYNCCADFSHDGSVDFADLGIIKVNFFTSAHTPSTLNQNCPP